MEVKDTSAQLRSVSERCRSGEIPAPKFAINVSFSRLAQAEPPFPHFRAF